MGRIAGPAGLSVSRRRQILFAGLMLAWLAAMAVNLLPGSRTVTSARNRWEILRGRGHMRSDSLNIDRFYGQFPDGNLFVRYEGFGTDTWDDRFWVMHNYYRGSYALYPRRLYVTDRNARLIEAPYILAANTMPEADWLDRHGVRYLLTVSREGSRVEVRR